MTTPSENPSAADNQQETFSEEKARKMLEAQYLYAKVRSLLGKQGRDGIYLVATLDEFMHPNILPLTPADNIEALIYILRYMLDELEMI